MTNKERNALRVMIAGGGTGGHVYPGIAVYNALRRLGERVDVLFVGATTGVERRIFEDLDLPHMLLPGRGVRGKSVFAKLTSPVVVLVSIMRAVRVVTAFKPDVVIGTGGYASVSVVAASILCGRRRVLHEQNSVPGLANRLLSRFADMVLLSYEESRSFIGRGVKCEIVGNPLRFKPAGNRAEACEFFGFDHELPTVLVFGGSRGARSINEAATKAACRILANRRVQFVFVTGANEYPGVAERMAEHDAYVRVYPFLESMQYAYAVADLSVARAGASSVFELAAFGVPTVFVPYPFAADDHQRHNVARLEDIGASMVIDDNDLDAVALEQIIVSLLDDEHRRNTMTTKMKGWARVDADEAAARKIMDVVSGLRLQHANDDYSLTGAGARTRVSQNQI